MKTRWNRLEGASRVENAEKANAEKANQHEEQQIEWSREDKESHVD